MEHSYTDMKSTLKPHRRDILKSPSRLLLLWRILIAEGESWSRTLPMTRSSKGLSVAYGVDGDGAGGSEHFGYMCAASLQVFRSSTRRNKPGHWTVPQVTSHCHHLSESGRVATYLQTSKF